MSGSAVQPPETRLNRVLVPLRVDTRVGGVLVVGTRKESSPLTLEDRQLIVAIANQLAVAVDRQGRAEREARARAVDESDRVKSALVSSVSHELKTPLTAIKMSVTGLFWTTSSTITRTSAANWRSRSIAVVVDDVLDRMKPIGAGRAIRRDIPNDSPLTPLDFVQISQVITNLLDNALRYSPASSGIAISAEVLQEQLRVTVLNEGHIPLGELDYIFDRFLSIEYVVRRNRSGIIDRARHCRGTRWSRVGGECRRTQSRSQLYFYHRRTLRDIPQGAVEVAKADRDYQASQSCKGACFSYHRLP